MKTATAQSSSEGRPRVIASPAHRTATARGLILLAAFASFVLSVSLWFSGAKQQGMFVGLWVPSILALGALMLSARRVE